MRMALHLNEEFYPYYLTTIAERRWILSRGLRLMVSLAADIDHGKAGRVLAEVAAYNPVVKAYYVADVNALQDPAAETSEAMQLQPALAQLMLPIHRLEDQVVIGETSLSFSLDLADARVRKLKEGVPAVIATTVLSTTFVDSVSVPPIPHAEAPPSSIAFEKELLDTTLEHTSAL
ncbi:hypothetical protein Tco_0091657 [Tanacetum coccineum]